VTPRRARGYLPVWKRPTRAAAVLGISLKTLHNKLKEYGVSQVAGPTPAV